MKPTHSEVKELFNYDEFSGTLTRKIDVANNAKKDMKVGWINSDGYLNVKIKRVTFKVHQIIWLWMKGTWPTGVIDHINRNKLDNRVSNLRDTTIAVNNINKGVRKDSKTGIPNVTWRERDKLFYVACRANGKQNYLGSYRNISDAKTAAEIFKNRLGGG